MGIFTRFLLIFYQINELFLQVTIRVDVLFRFFQLCERARAWDTKIKLFVCGLFIDEFWNLKSMWIDNCTYLLQRSYYYCYCISLNQFFSISLECRKFFVRDLHGRTLSARHVHLLLSPSMLYVRLLFATPFGVAFLRCEYFGPHLHQWMENKQASFTISNIRFIMIQWEWHTFGKTENRMETWIQQCDTLLSWHHIR